MGVMNIRSSSRRFGLRFLLILTGCICAVLALFYPRVYCSAVIDLGSSQMKGAPSPSLAPTYQLIADSPFMRQRLAESDPEAATILANQKSGWLKRQLTVVDLGNNRIEFRLVGRPPEKAKLRKLVDAIAGEMVNYLAESTTDVTIEAKELVMKAKSEVIQEFEASSSADEQKRLKELLNTINERLAELEKKFVTGVIPPKVVERSSGVEF